MLRHLPVNMKSGSEYPTLANPITSASTSIQLSTGSGAMFFADFVNGRDKRVMAIVSRTNPTITEFVLVTAIAGDVVTVTRGYEGSTAIGWLAGDTCMFVITAEQVIEKASISADIMPLNAGSATGTANALAASITCSGISSVSDGQVVVVRASLDNTGAATLALSVNGVAMPALPITSGGLALASGDIKAGQSYALTYSTAASSWQILSPSSPASTIYNVAMIGNSATVVIDPAKNAIIEITGSLSAQGAITVTLARSGQSFLAAFNNATSGGYLPVVNTNWTIPFGRSIWYYNHNTSTFVLISSSAVQAQLQSITSTVSANALTATSAATVLDFRSATLTSGTAISQVSIPALTLNIPSGATLGTVSGQAARLILLVAYNNGAPVLCVSNLAGALKLDETNLISPTTISAGATSASVIYSASTVAANSPYRVIGMIDITEATAGTWATAPTTVQGYGGQALAAMSSLGYGQTVQNVTGSRVKGMTYYNTTGKPITLLFGLYNPSLSVYTILAIDGIDCQEFGGSASAVRGAMFGIVPPGKSYNLREAAGGSSTLDYWIEIR